LNPALVIRSFLFCVTVALLPLASASGTVQTESDPLASAEDDVYLVTFHYEISIAKPARAIWPHLLDPGSWMYEFELAHVSGPVGQEGEVRRLYEEQDFFVQTTKLIENRLYVSVNLPSTFRDEFSTGIAIITLTEVNESTIVALTMSRRYTWLGEGPNPTREIRESEAFQESTRATWEEKFLPRLRQLAEADEKSD